MKIVHHFHCCTPQHHPAGTNDTSVFLIHWRNLGCSELTSWSAVTSTPGHCSDRAPANWAVHYILAEGTPGAQKPPPLGGLRHRGEIPATTPAVIPAITTLTNAACHSPSRGPSIRLHPGGSWEAGPCPALNKDILTFASSFSAATIMREW